MSFDMDSGAPASGTSGAPVDATYIVSSSDATLTNEVLVSDLAGAAATTKVVGVKVTGDAHSRIQIRPDSIRWGDGTAAAAEYIERTATSVFHSNTRFMADYDLYARFNTGPETKIGAVGPGAESAILFGSAGDTNLYRAAANTLQTDDKVKVNSVLGVVLANAALATSATAGFTYLPSCAGVPSGAAAAETGTVACVIDTTNSKFMAYIGGAWKGVTLS